MNGYRGIAALAALCIALAGSARGDDPKTVLIENVPHVRQKPDFCGEACAAMYLQYLKHDVTQDDIFNMSGLDPALGRGCYTPDLKRALEKIGFAVGPVWFKGPAATEAKLALTYWGALLADLEENVPSIVCMRTSNGRMATEHMRLMLGYDPAKQEVIYHEPAEDNGTYRRMTLDTFLDLWPLRYGTKEVTFIRFPLKAGGIKKPHRTAGFTPADYAQHVLELKKKVPRGFTIVVQPPFVVVGDESPQVVRRRAESTVKWSVDRLKRAYFSKDPASIMDIWLFGGKDSYRKHTKSIFNDSPDTPFGYCSSEHNALIMNIATGGGTLVHEIVHPFMGSNFPECPSWFNEGMGSLYEQSAGKGENIVGLTNWRLAGLQQAIRGGSVPSFTTLTSTTTYQFYREDPGTNYAQARYLCYYLQEKKLLRKYYHAFVKNHEKDPTGFETLKEILGEKDMDAFKKAWEAYVLKLRFP